MAAFKRITQGLFGIRLNLLNSGKCYFHTFIQMNLRSSFFQKPCNTLQNTLGLACVMALLIIAPLKGRSQTLSFEREKLLKASEKLDKYREEYLNCSAWHSFDSCILKFAAQAKTPFEKNVVANVIYSADAATSYKLHKEAWKKNPNELSIVMEYAIELHRSGDYAGATPLYEQCKKTMPQSPDFYVWLADCYINTGNIKRAIANWDSANHPKNHVAIEEAICSIYQRTNLFRARDSLRKKIASGNADAMLNLAHLDYNWEYNWWNQGAIGETFMAADVSLIESQKTKNPEAYRIVQTYVKIKNLLGQGQSEQQKLEALLKADSAKGEEATMREKIITLLNENGLILKGKPLPENGKILSDMLADCLANNAIDEKEFLRDRGPELYNMAIKTKNADLFNIYAYFSASNADSLRRIDSLGWELFAQERFALGLIRGKIKDLRYEDTMLNRAVKQFPNSSQVYIIKYLLGVNEKKADKAQLVELIRRDFKNINAGSGLSPLFGTGRNSYALKSFFSDLKGMENEEGK